MTRAIAITLLLTGLGAGALGESPAQPEVQFATTPEVYSYSPGVQSYMGVDIQDVTAARVGPLKLKEERGVEVTMVDQDAPAGKAGIREHDVILQFNGAAVESEEQLRRMLRETPAGRTVTLGISRDGNPMTISLQLADRGKIATTVRPRVVVPRVRVPEVEGPGFAIQLQTYSSVLGVQTENLSRQLGDYFGVKNGEGVLVRSVEKGSAAEKAGLKAGDVIVRADNEKLSDRADLSQILRNHHEGGKLTLSIMRDKREQSITVDLPPRGSDDSLWHAFPSEEFDEAWHDLQSSLRDSIVQWRPEIERMQRIASADASAAVRNARLQMREYRAQVLRAQRQAHTETRHMRRMIKHERKKLNRTWNQVI